MAFGSELGSAHISVFPSMRGFRSAVNKEVGASGKAASKAFDSSMNGGKSGGTVRTRVQKRLQTVGERFQC